MYITTGWTYSAVWNFVFRISLHHETTAASYLCLLASLLAALFHLDSFCMFFSLLSSRLRQQNVTAAHSDASSLTAKKLITNGRRISYQIGGR
jgi:hypothetical protein